MSEPSTIWALIPIKASGAGKTRLAKVLCEQERTQLVDAMLRHVVETIHKSGIVHRSFLVGPPRPEIATLVEQIDDHSDGLNAALAQAIVTVSNSASPPTRVLIIAADLPCLTPADIVALADLPTGTLGIACDRNGQGTNALSIPLTNAAQFSFHYGIESAAKHCAAAKELGLDVVAVCTPELEKDIDVPADLADAEHIFSLSSR